MAQAVGSPAVHMMRRLTCTACIGLTFLSASPLWAQSQVLSWDAPAGCPKQEDVLAAVQEITGPEVYERTTLHAAGRIRQVNGGFRLELGVEGDHGIHERAIEAKVCADLLGAAAVVLGLNLKRQASAAEEATREPEPASTSPKTTGNNTTDSGASTTTARKASSRTTSNTRSSSASDTPTTSGPDSDPNMWVAVPQVHVSIGSLPAPSVQWSAGVGWRSPEWLVWLSGRYQAVQTVKARTTPGVAADVSRLAAEIGVARGFRGEHFEWAPGLLLGVDYLMASGRGEDVESADARTTYPFVVASVSFRWHLARWFSLAAQVGAEFALAQPRLMVDLLGEVGQLGPVSGRLSLGSEWNF